MRRIHKLLTMMSGGGAAAWTPAQPLSGGSYALLIDPDTITGNDGDALASVIGSGPGATTYNFAQADGAKQPLLKKAANGINGHNVIRGDGSNDILVYPAGDISTASSGTIYVVYRLTDASKTQNVLLASCDEATADQYMMVFEGSQSSTVRTSLVMQVDTGTRICNTARLIDPATPTLFMIKSSGTAWTSRLQGNDVALTVASGTNNGNWFGDTSRRDNFTILGAKHSSEWGRLYGDMAYLLLYDFATTAEDDAKVEAFLRQRFGLIYANVGFTASNLAFNIADYDTSGNIYAGVGAVIKKSTDGGANWVDKYTLPGSPLYAICLFCASNGYIYASPYRGTSDWGLYRSVDGGDNWTKELALDENCCIWGIDECSDGTIIVGEYSWDAAGQMQIWRSTDDGDNWTQVYVNDTSAIVNDHIHDLRVDPSNGWVYATTGDAVELILRSKDNGATWAVIYTGDATHQGLAIGFLGGKVYIGSDSNPNGVWSFTDSGGASVTLAVSKSFPTLQNGNVFCAGWYGNYLVMGTYYNQTAVDKNLWITDGTTWSTVRTINGTLAKHGYQRISRHNYGGKFLISWNISDGTDQNGLIMDMTTASMVY